MFLAPDKTLGFHDSICHQRGREREREREGAISRPTYKQ